MERGDILRGDSGDAVERQLSQHDVATDRCHGVASEPSRDHVELRIIEIVRDYYSLPEDEPLSGETLFAQDLGADSLDSMEILMSIEEEYDVELGDHLSLQGLKSIRNASELLCSKLQAA